MGGSMGPGGPMGGMGCGGMGAGGDPSMMMMQQGGMGGGGAWGGAGDVINVEIPDGPPVNFLIGQGGQNVKQYEGATGTRIQVNKQPIDGLAPGRRMVTIQGGASMEARQNAEAMVRNRMQEYVNMHPEAAMSFGLQPQGGGGGMGGGGPMGGGGGMGGGGMGGDPSMMMMQQGMGGGGPMGGMQGGGGGGGPNMGPGGMTVPAGEFAFTMIIRQDAIGYIIGARGAKVKQIEADSGCRINCRDGSECYDENGVLAREVHILARSQESLEKCKGILQQAIIESLPSNERPGGTGEKLPPISDQEIMDLCAEREKCRRNRDYENADKIRYKLRDHGVEVNDPDRSWTCTDGRNGIQPSIGGGGGGGWGGKGGGKGGGGGWGKGGGGGWGKGGGGGWGGGGGRGGGYYDDGWGGGGGGYYDGPRGGGGDYYDDRGRDDRGGGGGRYPREGGGDRGRDDRGGGGGRYPREGGGDDRERDRDRGRYDDRRERR